MPPSASTAARGSTVRLDDIRPWLLSQTPETLASFILDAAAGNDRLRKRLLRHAATAAGKSLDLADYRKSIDQAIEVGRGIRWDEVSDYTNGIYDIASSLSELVANNHAATAKELAEYAFTKLRGEIFDRIHDNGELGMAMDEILKVHAAACRKLKTDPADLAQYLYDLEINDTHGYYSGITQRFYAALLGAAGAQRQKTLARQTLADTAGNNSDTRTRQYTARAILRDFARAENDTETLVALEVHDLSHPLAYHRIATIYHDAGQHDQALDWAERGLRAFPQNIAQHPCGDLVVFLINEYQRRAQHDKAVALAWDTHEKSPNLTTHQRLKQTIHAAKQDWPAWRDRALATLKNNLDAGIAKTPARQPGALFAPRAFSQPQNDYSELVRALLFEQLIEPAWQAAGAKGCNQKLWLELADKRATTHPADSIPVYLRCAEDAILRRNDDRHPYETAVAMLQKARTLHLLLNQAAQWDAIIASFRQKHARKRNFIKLAETL